MTCVHLGESGQAPRKHKPEAAVNGKGQRAREGSLPKTWGPEPGTFYAHSGYLNKTIKKYENHTKTAGKASRRRTKETEMQRGC